MLGHSILLIPGSLATAHRIIYPNLLIDKLDFFYPDSSSITTTEPYMQAQLFEYIILLLKGYERVMPAP